MVLKSFKSSRTCCSSRTTVRGSWYLSAVICVCYVFFSLLSVSPPQQDSPKGIPLGHRVLHPCHHYTLYPIPYTLYLFLSVSSACMHYNRLNQCHIIGILLKPEPLAIVLIPEPGELALGIMTGVLFDLTHGFFQR